MTSKLWTAATVALSMTLWPAPGISQEKPADKPAEKSTEAKPAADKPAPTDAEHVFAAMAGSWSGSGIISLSSGSRERLRCRAHHSVGQGGKPPSLSFRCASDSYRIDLTSNVVNRRGRIFGSWSESSYGASGSVSGSAAGGRIRAVATSSSFSAGLAITTSGGHQSVSITPRGTPIAAVHISLRKI